MNRDYEKYRNKIDYIEDYKKALNAASGSKFDSNANVENKNVTTCTGELPKEDMIGVNRLMMIDEITELYGEKWADKYIERLKSHVLYRHDETNPLYPYCVSLTLYPFLTDGITKLGGSSEAPKHLESFAGAFLNLCFAVAAQFAGAVSTPEFLPYLDYFIRKDYGDDYYLHPDEVVDLSARKRSIVNIIDEKFDQVVYSLNDPAGARNFQSIFWNIAYFDRPYFEGLFENFVFPDGTEMQWESVSWLQKHFMKWFNKTRLRKPLTFPVETLNLLDDGEDYVDQEWADFAAEMLSEGHSFFQYHSNSVDSLASCCFAKDQKVLTKSSNGVFYGPIAEVVNGKYEDYRRNFTVFHNGAWVKAKPVKLPSRQMYRVVTSNKKEMVLTDNHLNLTDKGLVSTKDLSTEDYLAFNTRALNSFPEKDSHLTYEEGFIVGAYAGDGSHNRGADMQKKNYQITLSLNESNIFDLEALNKGLIDLGLSDKKWVTSIDGKLMTTTVSSKVLYDFIFSFVKGGYAYNKEFSMNCLLESVEFRKGIIDGWYATDGGNSNRIYSVSPKLIETGEVILTSLGRNSVIDISDRVGEVAFIDGEKEYKHNFPLYCLRWYDMKNKRSMKDIYKVSNNTEYFKIASIEKIDYAEDSVYCFEMDAVKEPYFTLPNGIITHNCRLRNEFADNTFSFTLGAGGIATGSKGVITINMSRLIQLMVKREGTFTFDLLEKEVAEITDEIHKYLTAFNEILKKSLAAHMLPVYEAGFISLEKQFLTIGVNGFVEGAEFLGFEPEPGNEGYAKYCNTICKTIYESNKAALTPETRFNTEFVPRMSGHLAA